MRLVVIASLVLLHSSVNAEPVDFVRNVQPILKTHCYACHGEAKQKSGLRLDIKSEAFKGGDAYGPSLVAGKSVDSPLIQMITSPDKDSRMPPEGDGLSVAEIATLTQWVEAGALWPDGVDLFRLEDRRDHWSYRAMTEPMVPDVGDPAWPRNAVDRFVLARLEAEGLKPAPDADAVTWLRRVTLDLTGLPPTPEQVAAFVLDSTNDARERVVDELLDSPRYGERWAQHWLDVVRYADTHGFEVNTERPHAWPYRDYVIDAFNKDTPYDLFIREQIAGDALGQDAATGFLITASVLLPGQIGADEPSKRLARQDSLDEIVVNISQTFLGLSVGCARCHDHKFDPITQRDYYAMQAFIAGVEYADRDIRTPEALARQQAVEAHQKRVTEIDQALSQLEPLANPKGDDKSLPRRLPLNAKRNIDRIVPVPAKQLRFTIHATNNLEPCIDELEVFTADGTNVALASTGTMVTSSGDNIAPDRHELRFLNDGNYGNSRSWMSNETGKGWVILEFAAEPVIERIVWGRDREGMFTDRLATDYRIEVADAAGEWRLVASSLDRSLIEPSDAKSKMTDFSTVGLTPDEAQRATALQAEKTDLASRITAARDAQKAFAGAFRKPDVIRLLHRGDPEQPKDEVVPAVLSTLGTLALASDTDEQQRRIALAEWIANPQNPLTARVMVNRIWQGHFGTGLVETASDLGRTGTKPTHPELLDWLAQEFIRSGWSIKQMHRLIVLSATYRQSTQHNAMAAAKDADVRLLWRYPSRRLEAETIRDTMLAVSGRLDLKMGGRGFNLFDQRGGLSGFKPVESFQGDGLRRMIYAHKVRREREAVFGAFDCPDAGQSTARRRESTTPIQALNLFNSRFTIEQSEAFAARLKSETGDNITNQIRRAYQIAFHREPSSDELADTEPVIREHGLATLCRAIFNSNEFLFLP